ncbi:MAG: fibronectin type III domain-containing protein [Butyricicoccus pullicaecorum]|nr:fibronectin type III domain-containing protein [Butyricicoccus pullicaecorum]
MNGGHGYFVDHGKSVSLYYGESVTLFAAEKYNHPPNTPDSITLPSTIKGGSSCSISWSAATDPDSNLEGYIVERSYNGGSSWNQIYQGAATSTSTTIPHGTGTVMFRVCAYDTDGEKSGWRTSSNKTVLNNRAPSAPPSINVPLSPQGGASLSVTWSAASDPDGNLEGYRLERQWDGKGSWTQIYQGSNLSYAETIPKGTYQSVAYRVRAYDSFGETSGYTASPVRTINNNAAPVIQCDLSGDLGDKSEGFTIPYTVTDAENQTVTVTEKVGGMTKRTYQVTLGQSNTFQITGSFFQKILNGRQTAEIIATDSAGASTTLALTFTKKVHKAVIALSEPLAVENQITVCIIKVLGNIPADAAYKVEVTNNAADDAPAWEDATQDAKLGRNHVFVNKTQVNGWKFAFRVTAERGESQAAGYITSVQGGFQ